MKILLLNDQGAATGGAEQVTLRLREGLRARGHDARLFSSTAGSTPETLQADYACFGTTSRARNAVRAANPSARRRLRAVLRDFRPDVVHLRMFLTQLSPVILPLLRDVPTVYHASWYAFVCPNGLKLLPDRSRCTDPAGPACLRHGCYGPVGWGAVMLQRVLLERWRGTIDRIVANSAAVRDTLVAHGVEPVGVIWNGVPVRPLRPALADPPTVSYAGRLSPEKGVDVLVRAFGRVVGGGLDARLLVAGDGPERRRLVRLADELGLADRVTWTGHLDADELERRLAPAWVHAVPSRLDEPFGVAAAEAMMRGTAVVASDGGGLAEVVRAGETGLRVPPGDEVALAGALGHLLTDRDTAERMGRAGRDRALAHFSEDAFVEAFLGVYGSLLDPATS